MKRFLSVLLLSLFAGVVMAGTEVYTPSLKSPANNTTDVMPNVIISWNAIVGSVNLQYEVQVDTTVNFNSPQLSDTIITLLTGFTNHELLFGAKYYWRVRAIDLGQTSPWSGSWSFTVFSQVTLSFPKNNAKEDTLAPTQSLAWLNTVGSKTITGVKFFDVQLDTSPNFNSTQFHSGTVSSIKYFFKVTNLKFGYKYYWRARARHDLSTGQWSQVFNFTVTKAAVPTAPTNNSIDQVLNVKLTWKAVKGLLGYEYQLATDTNFTNLINGSEVDTNFVASEFTKFGGKYYWRARMRHATDTTKWCARWSFTTIDMVKLNSPANNATNIAVKPIFKWTKQTGIVKFELQVDVNQNFTTPYIVKISDTLTQYTLTKKLNNSTVYYWRMRAFANTDGPDTSGWSAPWAFTTLPSTGIDENGMLSSSIYPNPASGKVNVKVRVDEPTTVQMALIDLLGTTYIKDEYELSSGDNIREINISNLSKGVYILRLVIDGNVSNHKLIVDR